MVKYGPDIWNSIISDVLINKEITISKVDSDGDVIPSPSESGLFKRSVGEPKGQIADWRASINSSDRGVHVVEYKDKYSVHVDKFDPQKRPLMHLVHDSPRTAAALTLIGIGITALIRSRIGKKK